MHKFIPVLVLWLFSVVANAQITVKGKVRNQDRVPVIGASIIVKADTVGAITDSLGNFTFKILKKDKITLVATLLGYQTDSVTLPINSNIVTAYLTLKDNNQRLNTVQIQRRKAFNPPNDELLTGVIQTAIAPGAAADVTAAMQVLPGAVPTANETGFFVRGGHANESLVLFDGMVVKNAFGSKLPDLANRSRFSAFLFDRTSFSTSGYSAINGQALSSVLTMETKDLVPASSTEFAIINLGLGLARTERFKNSSLTLGANYYNFKPYHQVIKQNTLWQKDPIQYQTSLNYKHKFKKGTLKAFVDYSDTDLAFDIINPNKATFDLLENRNKNIYLNTNYQGYINASWRIFAGTAYNKTTERGNYDIKPYFQDDQLLQQKVMFTNQILRYLPFRVGAEYFYNQRNEGIDDKTRGYSDILSAAFTEIDFNLFTQASLNLGFRAEHSRYLRKMNASPRVALIVNPLKGHKLMLHYGHYLQKPDDSFLSASDQLDFERNKQFAVDYEFLVLKRLLKLSAYHKAYDHLTKIVTPVFSGFQPYGPPLELLSVNSNGYGFANGAEVFFKDTRSIRYGQYSIAYSWLNTKRNYIDYQSTATPTFAPKHTLNFNFHKFSNKLTWIFAANYAYNNGRTYFNPNNASLMGDRVKDFHNLSASVSHIPRWLGGFSTLSININNILGLNQIYGYRYSYDGNNRIPIRPAAKRNILVSFLMNLDGQDFNR